MTDFSARPSVRIMTLGCKVNFCDSSSLLEALLQAGFAAPEDGRSADVEILNTCAVTRRSVARARMLARRLRNANPAAVIIVTGCATRTGEDSIALMSEVDKVCPTKDRLLLYLAGRYGMAAETADGGFDPERTRAFVAIQDGCEAFCSYCIVPLVRGAPRSIVPERVVELCREAVERGYSEIVLCGIHLGQYGRDLGGASLAEIAEKAAGIDGRFRIRFSSLEPLEVTGELLSLMASDERFCPHLHLPLQSGSDRILKLMNRPYRAGQYMEVLARARETLNNPAITTDIIVGFPGETEEDHEATLRAVAEAGFARGHVFVFSPRPGTAAAGFAGRVGGKTARRRSSEVREACAATARAYGNSLAGVLEHVVPEEAADGVLEGFCARYQRVRFTGSRELLGSIVPVYIIGWGESPGALKGQMA